MNLKLVHSVAEAEEPTDGRAVLVCVEDFAADLIERSESVRHVMFEPPEAPVPLSPQERKAARRMSALASALFDPEVGR